MGAVRSRPRRVGQLRGLIGKQRGACSSTSIRQRTPPTNGPFRCAAEGRPFFLRAVIPVTALREALCLVCNSNGAGQRGVSEMSYHQGDRIKLRAHWLAIEFVFYLLGLLTLVAQLASLLTSLPPT